MKTNLVALAAGLLFGFGLALSHMADPDKVLAFLDVVGGWDPSLALVMAGAVLVFAPAFFLINRTSAPWLGKTFHLPTRTNIDHRLIGGAALFGLGWGLAGYCPGPALAALSFNAHEAIPFVASIIVGGWTARWLDAANRRRH